MAANRKNIHTALIENLTVAASQSVLQGQAVIRSATGTATPGSGPTSLITHIAYSTEDGVWPATAGDKIGCIRIGSPCSVPVLVGTGGATVNVLAKCAADGATDATTGGATTVLRPVCMWDATGVAGTLVSGWLGVSPTVGS